MTGRVGILSILFVLLIAALAAARSSGTEGSGAEGDIPRYRVPANLVELVEDGERPPQVDRDALVVTYCGSGARASRAQATLERMGFENVVNFGGVASWPEDLVTGDSPR
jgi:rhodanese-related sulfurtransferase